MRFCSEPVDVSVKDRKLIWARSMTTEVAQTGLINGSVWLPLVKGTLGGRVIPGSVFCVVVIE